MAVRLSGAFEEFTGTGECYRLIQHPLADAEVFADPFVHLGILARYTLAPDAVTGRSSATVSFYFYVFSHFPPWVVTVRSRLPMEQGVRGELT